MKKILISAMALAAVSLAGAQTVRNLVVTDLEGRTTQFPADQVGAVVFQEMPEYRTLTHFLQSSYEESGESGLYIIEFGTSEPDASGDPLEIGDLQVALLMKAPKSETLLEPKLPAGYYKIGNSTDDYTFDVNRSAVWIRTEEGSDGVSPQMIVDGTADVRVDENGNYDIRMEFTTFSGTVDLRYEGQLPFPPGVSEFEIFSEPVDLTFTNGQGRFYGNWFYPFAADLTAQFYVGKVSGGSLTDGYMLDLSLYEPKPADCMAPGQRIADGTYSVETRQSSGMITYLPYRFKPGSYLDFQGQLYVTGSNLTYISETGRRKLGFITGGTITVSGNGTEFVFDLTTAEGVSVKGTYNGTPAIINYCDNDESEPKRPYSGLTGDVTLDWDPATVAFSYNLGHDIIDTANDFVIMFTVPDQSKGDYIYLELFSDGDELADGTYTIDSTLEAGHGIPGTVAFGESPLFSWYGDLSVVDSEGYHTDMGPIASGTVTVSTEAGGRRKFVFNLKDDKGNGITGEYTGVLNDGEQSTAAGKIFKGVERKLRRAGARTRK